MNRWQRIGAGLFSLLGLALAFLALLTYRPAPPLPDLKPYLARAQDYDVRIRRDLYGVPHIYGKRDADVGFGLAYAHAEDDFATIQTVVMATRGRLAEIIGPKGAPSDVLVGLMRIWPIVDAHYHDLSQPVRALVEAYADGINLYAAEHPGAVTPGMLPVTGQDVVAGFVHKTPFFWGFERVVMELFEPERRRTLSMDGKSAFTPVLLEAATAMGSNGIAVSPAKSSDGATRLFVNSHQPWTGPVAWYEARLHSDEGWDVAGGLFPGSPLMLHGHNRHLGWANTVNKPGLADTYVLTINKSNDAYLFDGAWRPFETKRAQVRIHLFGRFYWTYETVLKFSAHGPVFERPHGTYALRWANMGEFRQLEEYLALNKARDFAQWKSALSMQALASINYVYADEAGHIAYVYNARIPDRDPAYDWRGLLPGDTSRTLWQDYLPFARIPMVIDPPSGFVINSNHTPFRATSGPGNPNPDDFPKSARIEGLDVMTNRGLRGLELLSAAGPLDEDGLIAIKMDDQYAQGSRARAIVNQILAAPEPSDTNLIKTRKVLADWDFSTGRDNHSAALAILTLYPIVVAELTGKPAIDPERALAKAAEVLQSRFHRLDPAWGEVSQLHRGDLALPLDGAPDTLRAIEGANPDISQPYIPTVGDSFIMLVSWDKVGKLNSKSVHVFGSATLDKNSPHYADQSKLFAGKQFKPVWFEERDLMAHLEREYRPGTAIPAGK
jgi:penicillin amidase/acyl-homoserine-lactone acylase